jgi:hypothetical protein
VFCVLASGGGGAAPAAGAAIAAKEKIMAANSANAWILARAVAGRLHRLIRLAAVPGRPNGLESTLGRRSDDAYGYLGSAVVLKIIGFRDGKNASSTSNYSCAIAGDSASSNVVQMRAQATVG